MKRDMKALLKVNGTNRRTNCGTCNMNFIKLKPETNLALMMCLVFFIYICLGGALFLLLEGQSDSKLTQTAFEKLIKRLNFSYNDYHLQIIKDYCDETNVIERRKLPEHENLWNFFESTDFTYQIVTAQGTGQTSRILYTKGGKVAYIFVVLLGVPLAALTLRATGQRLNMVVYSTIRFFNVRLFHRQLTPNIHIKALVLNVTLLFMTIGIGTIMYVSTQNWTIIDSWYYTVSIIFTISNSHEKIINNNIKINSNKDKLFRALFNTYSFAAFTVVSSLAWSAHLFTRHMRFKAQNQTLAKNGDNRVHCPWVEVTHGQPLSPCKSSKEKDTDRESVC
ncbi:two pore potassium channel protein sup-9 [Hydra vulgaris]|uniref:two pore potassium channel protein sup-9 n=1 Tax=Hydra vulgaris TaxID=6087 RepID=UPI0002B43E1B|nr:two pore potassium channel protein sup-9 [Hydra vulgaris]XP_047125615.1 two pore potassium channel protein sup-9 [Hydra vulgaris]